VEVYFGFIILGSMLSAIALRFSFFNKNDLVNLCSKNYRLQLILNHVATLIFNSFVPVLCFENDFSYALEDDKLVPGKINNFEMKNMSRGKTNNF